jgi:hypothetical protein
MEPLTKKYLAALASLRGKLAKAGDLEGALIVKSEEDGTNKTAVSKQPRQLVALNRIYESTRDRKSEEVTKIYIKALHALQVKLTRSGELEDAQKVKTEHQKYIKGGNDTDKDESSTTVKLSKTQFKKLMVSGDWEWRASHKYSGEPDVDNVRFAKDGTCSIDWVWKWEIANSSSLKVYLHDRTYFYFEMDIQRKRGKTNVEKTTFEKAGKQNNSIMLKK